MILRLDPDLVKDHQSVQGVGEGDSFAPAQRAWTMRDRSEAGHIGYPKEATAEKGTVAAAVCRWSHPTGETRHRLGMAGLERRTQLSPARRIEMKAKKVTSNKRLRSDRRGFLSTVGAGALAGAGAFAGGVR